MASEAIELHDFPPVLYLGKPWGWKPSLWQRAWGEYGAIEFYTMSDAKARQRLLDAGLMSILMSMVDGPLPPPKPGKSFILRLWWWQWRWDGWSSRLTMKSWKSQ